MRIWEKLKHKNVLPLLGIMMLDGFPCMVSTWMENGTMNAYLKVQSGANILRLVRGILRTDSLMLSPFKIRQIADGLSFLHSCEVVHSDLKGVRDHDGS